MANGEWFKNMINPKKVKDDKPSKLKGSSTHKRSNRWIPISLSRRVSSKLSNNLSAKIHGMDGMSIEDIAATQIQSAFRSYKARKAFRRLKGTRRIKTLLQGDSAKRQASTTLRYLHSWSMMQAEVKSRRVSMVMEGRIKKKRLEDRHKLEVEWNSSSETMEQVLSKIHQRDEAALKRERTMAYAYSHQWRPNSNFGGANPVFGKVNCGWSWMDRWIAARPWESQVPARARTEKGYIPQKNMMPNNLTTLTTNINVKTVSPKGKIASKAPKMRNAGPRYMVSA